MSNYYDRPIIDHETFAVGNISIDREVNASPKIQVDYLSIVTGSIFFGLGTFVISKGGNIGYLPVATGVIAIIIGITRVSREKNLENKMGEGQ